MVCTITIIQGHLDPEGGHLCHAFADAYAAAARDAGHRVNRIDIATSNFPLLRTKAEFESAPLPADLASARHAISTAENIVLIFPLWLGTMPALLKAFLEQLMRPGFAFQYQEKGFPKKQLKGLRADRRDHGNASVPLSLAFAAVLRFAIAFSLIRHPTPSFAKAANSPTASLSTIT